MDPYNPIIEHKNKKHPTEQPGIREIAISWSIAIIFITAGVIMFTIVSH